MPGRETGCGAPASARVTTVFLPARLIGLCLALFLATGAVAATVVDLNGVQLERYHELTGELRCLICQNRSIAESDVPLAKDLKDVVARQIAAGRSDAEIKQFLVERYGDWVLYDPPFRMSTWILWLGPFALLLIGLVIVATIMRRRRESAAQPPLDRERLARVLGERQPDSDSTDKD